MRISEIIDEINRLPDINFNRESILGILTGSSSLRPTILSNGIFIDYDKRIVLNRGMGCTLAKKEFELLYYFMSNANTYLSREDILRNVWSDVIVVEETISVHIYKIKKKLNADFIHSKKRVGYAWLETDQYWIN